ncbi:exodeoxyribonuclease VII large subunit [Pigmentibacter sp. JX0631]|uniref:exodeoxyribonuclease VII large subunit n=1 Tax=Pigmentibacter sp. JX0631 TaxID=2976982 RepID=UPI002469A599|nr:exodeoxyribonuclease VII large subunit [Pigmentibacter sp. JX0631]WGL60293.1 exodeoxyribonuclease VII large subunit [Pigmentibacter sp. JX0631]
MKLLYNKQEQKIILSGNTFNLKEKIKNIGGKWDPLAKNWWFLLTETNIDSLKKLGFSFEDQVEILNQEENYKPVDSYSVTNFLQIINSILSKNLQQNYWICGEITNLKQSNGHLFFELVDKEQALSNFNKAASIPCIIWANGKKILEPKLNQILLSDGTKIKILIRCEFRKEGAKIVGIVENIDINFTQGELALQRLAIVQSLKKKGLYHKNKALPFPQYPLKIALFTAKDSRAYSDFLDELSLSKISFKVTVFDCNMQGEKTSENIVSAFQIIAKNIHSFDCVVITRGGGSKLDLRWFDDFAIAEQIALSPIPVITAIGHFDDNSIADEVANIAEKTPTAAAGILTDSVLNSYQLFFQRIDNITYYLLKRLAKEKNLVLLLQEKCTSIAINRIQTEQKNIKNIEKMLKIIKSSIEQNLQRGFALVYDEQGNLLQGKHFLQESFSKNLKLKFAGDCENHHIFVEVKVKAVSESREST